MIGIGVTTCNRPKVFEEWMSRFKIHAPKEYKLAVYDDTDTCIGVAAAKNKLLEELDGCEKIYLFDDDCFVLSSAIWAIDFGERHYTCTWSHNHRGNFVGHKKIDGGFETSCGCFLYFSKKHIDVCGGFDVGFGKYGHEHIGLTDRINNTFGYEKIHRSFEWKMMLYPLDYYDKVKSSVEKRSVRKNDSLLLQEKRYIGWKPYKKTNLVLGSYFTELPCPQRKQFFSKSLSNVEKWIDSIIAHEATGVLFYDNIDEAGHLFELAPKGIKFVKIDTIKLASEIRNINLPISVSVQDKRIISPNNLRFLVYRDFLLRYRRYIESVWTTDTTDVELLQNPFEFIKMQDGVLYCGCEEHWDKKWLNKQAKKEVNHDLKLLNCGIIGGKTSEVIKYLNFARPYLQDNSLYDMAALNMYAELKDNETKISYDNVSSKFKYYDYKCSNAVFRHK